MAGGGDSSVATVAEVEIPSSAESSSTVPFHAVVSQDDPSVTEQAIAEAVDNLVSPAQRWIKARCDFICFEATVAVVAPDVGAGFAVSQRMGDIAWIAVQSDENIQVDARRRLILVIAVVAVCIVTSIRTVFGTIFSAIFCTSARRTIISTDGALDVFISSQCVHDAMAVAAILSGGTAVFSRSCHGLQDLRRREVLVVTLEQCGDAAYMRACHAGPADCGVPAVVPGAPHVHARCG
mmetsp:Transcript_3176/g.9002  ORF Transcript_3176/g.9002 Transcript_3176/m.9002 type:complete len:237 (+) Transcript_3176:158-868(+)